MDSIIGEAVIEISNHFKYIDIFKPLKTSNIQHQNSAYQSQCYSLLDGNYYLEHDHGGFLEIGVVLFIIKHLML